MDSGVVATFDGGGNVPVMLAIAEELTARGRSVTVMTHRMHAPVLESHGLQVLSYATARHWDPLASTGSVSGAWRLARTATDSRIGDDLVAAIAELSPTEVVTDCMLLGAQSRLGRENISYTTVFHTLYQFWNGRFRFGPAGLFSQATRLGDPRTIWARSQRRVVCADAALDPGFAADSGIDWVGAIHGVTSPSIKPARPQVLLSLSTVGYPGMQAVLQKLLDACAGVDADFVVTTGPAISPGELTHPANARVERYIDHNEVMPTCSAVIGHGGHSTAMRALAHGLPILTVPMHPLIDQPIVGAAIEASGAGINVARSSSVAAFRDAIARLVGDLKLREAAETVGARIRAQDGAAAAADLLVDHPGN